MATVTRAVHAPSAALIVFSPIQSANQRRARTCCVTSTMAMTKHTMCADSSRPRVLRERNQ